MKVKVNEIQIVTQVQSVDPSGITSIRFFFFLHDLYVLLSFEFFLHNVYIYIYVCIYVNVLEKKSLTSSDIGPALR